MEKPPLNQLTTQEWENLMEDFQSGINSRIEKWVSQYSSYSSSILELILSTLLRKDISFKLQLIVFIEEAYNLLIPKNEYEIGIGRIIETLRAVIQAPVDGISVTYSSKEQLMISVTSIIISIDGLNNVVHHLESLIELLLTVINRPNHGLNRQTRAVACECLRELEREYPCILVDISGHIWNLCQSERTHASQSYILLLTSVIHDLVVSKVNGSIIGTSVPLVPFNVPQSVIASSGSNYTDSSTTSATTVSNSKELRRVMAFLLEHPHVLTPCALMEFMSMIMPIAAALDLQASLLKVQFSGLLYSYDPMLCHVVLMLYSRFSDAFDGQEAEIARRLMLISKEAHHYLIFRLLALHWLLGFINLPSIKREAIKKSSLVSMSSSFYPKVFDPLALKSMKLDMLAYCAICVDNSVSQKSEGVTNMKVKKEVSVVKLLEDGLVSVSSFKWLPSWSTETTVAFRTFHKFLIGATPHSASNDSTAEALMESTIFQTLQRTLVDMALEYRGLVPISVAFLDRLLGCHSHRWLGERLLQTFDEHLLTKVTINYQLASYFPIFNRIAENHSIPPSQLLELLTQFLVALVEKHGPDTALNSWSLGNKVLCICRTMLMHHSSSRVFLILSRLLTFTCLYFPDLEIRDNARIYLRMLICIPDKKLRHILNLEEQVPGISPSPHMFPGQSPQASEDLNKSRNISSYIHLERITPLLVRQTWSLSLAMMDNENNQLLVLESTSDSKPVDGEADVDSSSEVQVVLESDRMDMPREPLRVMDSKVSEILEILRLHFSCIPDFRHMSGFKITIPCTLRFESEPFNCIWGVGLPATNLDEVDALPAIYATIITFASSAPYGSIPSFHIPFLLGGAKLDNDYTSRKSDYLAIVPLENGSDEQETFGASVTIELEPREPMPGLVDVSIEANAENGQIIRGQLQSITVGIEDMFLKARIPSDIPEEAFADYYSDLFNALWEACDCSSNTGRETFPLMGGKGVAAINGTRSVKLLEVSAALLIDAVESHLAPFIVSVVGEPLISAVSDGGIIKDVFWKEGLHSAVDENTEIKNFDLGPLQLKYTDDDADEENYTHYQIDIRKRNMGCFFVLIFLPPRFHLLFQMEVGDASTLVRIRTDHWPCLAYIDDYLEALFLK
ncbi:hypothetical protein MKX01_036046 [Papaver californicum]|nr:hypothetical protein MKX01_036046 [Papaver californicum]